MTKFVFKLMNFVLEMMNSVLKMINFAFYKRMETGRIAAYVSCDSGCGGAGDRGGGGGVC